MSDDDVIDELRELRQTLEKSNQKMLKELEQQTEQLRSIAISTGLVAGVFVLVLTMAVLAFLHQQFHWF